MLAMSTVQTPVYDSGLDGELPNLAKVRLRKKAGVKDGTDISGTLTIKSGENALMVLALTGVVGDPCITTEDIPDAVKYVPYGTVIQNSNKYSWIQPSYELSGNLPEGMELRPNGELYGVPQETGSFEFEVKVSFKSTVGRSFPTQTATFTLTVEENTDENVYLESDEGYGIVTHIGEEDDNYHYILNRVEDTLYVSEGSFDEFIDLWLNGKKLEKGVDYNVESGSTRITVIEQTMQNVANQNGRNTIAAEFRVNGDINDNLKRISQNFYIDTTTPTPTPKPDPTRKPQPSDKDSGNTGGNNDNGSGAGNSDAGNTGGNNGTGTGAGNNNAGNTGGNNTTGSGAGNNTGGNGAGAVSAKTGDSLEVGGWMALILLSIGAMAGFVILRKKHVF